MRRINYIKDYIPNVYEYNDEENTRYLLGNAGQNPMLCFGINPSYACLEFSDPTMNELIKKSKQFGYDSCIMMNPYPLRGPKPSELPYEANMLFVDKNYIWIERIFKEHQGQHAYAMWGDFIDSRNYFTESVIAIYNLSKKYNIKWMCVGSMTKKTNPRHFSWLIREFNRTKNEEIFVPCELNMDEYVKGLKKAF